jgi:hypothetical protein
MEALHSLLEQQAEKNTIIIVFANDAYRKVLDNWLVGMHRLGLDNLLIFALDTDIGRHLDDLGVANLVIDVEPNLGALWIRRMEIVMEVLEAGYDVIHSDADAVWLKNPVQRYFTNPPYDMIFSQGTYWPLDVHEQWGFVLCCGLFYIKSTESTLFALRAMYRQVLGTRDDQIACNRVLRDLGVKWEIAEEYRLEFNGRPFRCSPEPIVGMVKNLRIMLLPHREFQRIAESADTVYVKHHIAEKKAGSKLAELQASGCYFL